MSRVRLVVTLGKQRGVVFSGVSGVRGPGNGSRSCWPSLHPGRRASWRPLWTSVRADRLCLTPRPLHLMGGFYTHLHPHPLSTLQQGHRHATSRENQCGAIFACADRSRTYTVNSVWIVLMDIHLQYKSWPWKQKIVNQWFVYVLSMASSGWCHQKPLS